MKLHLYETAFVLFRYNLKEQPLIVWHPGVLRATGAQNVIRKVNILHISGTWKLVICVFG